MRFANKVVVVTGAGSGIGRATACLFAREGAKTVVADINEKNAAETVNIIESAGGTATCMIVDVSSENEIKRLIAESLALFGHIDILYNNAGINNSEKRLADLDVEEWDRVIDVNLKSVFLGIKYVVPAMIKQGGGVIINTASVLGFKGMKYQAPYNASKGGIVLLTKNAALEYGKDNIRVNAVAPGVIDTNIINEWKQNEWKWGILQKANALGRIGQPEEIAKAVLFLASEDASFITAETLMVDGGTITF